MKKTIEILVLISQFVATALSANAVEVQILGPRAVLIAKDHVLLAHPEKVSVVTLDFLQKRAIPFEGDKSWISSIENLGGETKPDSLGGYKAYGWCFKINGERPETLADETVIRDADTLVWYYAYGYVRRDGRAGDMCIPAE